MERIISAERVEDILNVFGSFDQNLHIIEKEWNVCVTDRDAELKISGEPEDVVSAEKAVQNLLMLAARGENVDEQRVRYVIGMIRSGQEDQIRELDSGVVCITAKGRPVKPKTLGQKAYVQAIRENTVTLGIEPEIETVNGAELTYTVTLTTPNGEEKVYTGSPKEIAVENPQLWWPHGLGEQPLYTVRVDLQRDGETGRKKIVAITRYLTVGLALIESGAMAVGFGRQGLLVKYNFVNAAIVVLTLTAGSAFLMWIGERITEKGVGNGISIVLVINIISRIPSDMKTLFDQFVKGKAIASACLAVCVIIAIILALVVFTVILQDGERRIAVQYSQKIVGRRSYGGQSTNIPLKVNTAGVIPIIFSSSLMQFPIVIASFLGKDNGSGIGSEILRGLNQSNWCNPEQIKYSWGLVLYIVLTVFFAYFYTSITFNPLEIANNMKKSGGFIPGIRPGRPTVEYLTKILNYIIFVGACGLILVQIVPILFNGWLGAKVSFGGTSLIIIVSVILETLKQIDSMTLVRTYKGFLNS